MDLTKEEEILIREISNVLAEWNPLGEEANLIADLNGYKFEAMDLILWIEPDSSETYANRMVRTVLNEAYGLSLKKADCIIPAKKILEIIKESSKVSA